MTDTDTDILNTKRPSAEQVDEFLSTLGIDTDELDIEALAFDLGNSNADLTRIDELQTEYGKLEIVKRSIVNGQFTQAKQQASQYGFNYELVRYQTLSEME